MIVLNVCARPKQGTGVNAPYYLNAVYGSYVTFVVLQVRFFHTCIHVCIYINSTERRMPYTSPSHNLVCRHLSTKVAVGTL